jgi:hypothetical protein
MIKPKARANDIEKRIKNGLQCDSRIPGGDEMIRAKGTIL